MTSSLVDIPVTRIDGSSTTLAPFRGKVVLIVNVASKCGYTPQYEGLEALYRTYRDRGLVVAGFPSNDFGGQEPDADTDIARFCSTTYGVDFPMFAKLTVLGPDKHPLYRALIAARPEIEFRPGSYYLKRPAPPASQAGREVVWNFEKFLLDRSGSVVHRFGPDTKPEDPAIVAAIETALTARAPAAVA